MTTKAKRTFSEIFALTAHHVSASRFTLLVGLFLMMSFLATAWRFEPLFLPLAVSAFLLLAQYAPSILVVAAIPAIHYGFGFTWTVSTLLPFAQLIVGIVWAAVQYLGETSNRVRDAKSEMHTPAPSLRKAG